MKNKSKENKRIIKGRILGKMKIMIFIISTTGKILLLKYTMQVEWMRRWNKNSPSEILIVIFNRLYKIQLRLDDTELNLSKKSLLTDGLMKLCFIKFRGVKKLFLNNNIIYHLNDLPNSSFDRLRVLSLQAKARTIISQSTSSRM